MKKKRGSIVTDYLPEIIIAVIILVIVLVAIFFITGTGTSLIAKIKSIFRGG
jgi:hypothetical protein